MDMDDRNKFDNENEPSGPKSGGEWTKERTDKARPFDFDAFLGEKSLEDRVSDALDGKDRPEGKPGAGARGRHEAPGPDPEPEPGPAAQPEEKPEAESEPAYPGGPPIDRFTRDGVSAPERQRPQQPSRPQAQPARPDAGQPVRPKRPAGPEPPPRPKVVVAEPAPRVVVTPERRYVDDEPSKKGMGKTGKVLVALLITLAVVLAAAVAAVKLLPGITKDPDAPAPSPTDYLFGGLPTRAPSVPTAPPAPTAPPVTDPPMPTPAPVVYHTISVTAGTGGSVSPNGAVDVEEGGSVTFSILPDAGYELGQLLIDGANVSVTGSYTFTDVRQDHTLYAVFQQLVPTVPPATEPPVVTDPPVIPEQPDVPVAPDQPEQQPDLPPAVEG